MYIVLIQNIDELRECRCYPNTLLILNALHSLKKNFLDNLGKIFSGLAFRNLVQIHEHGYERSLSVTGHQGNQLVLNGLDTVADLCLQTILCQLIYNLIINSFATLFTLSDNLGTNLLTADVNERSQVRQREGLSAVLVGSNLSHNLGGYVTSSKEAVWTLNHGLGNHGSVPQHIL